jgi:hypothetical protein
LSCPARQIGEFDRVRDIWRVGSRRREAAPHQLGVDEQAVARAVDVGEAAAVAVARLDVADQPHLLALHQLAVGAAGRLAEALDRRARLDRLRRVDADVADRLLATALDDADRVAVDDPQDARGRLRRRRLAAAGERQERRNGS